MTTPYITPAGDPNDLSQQQSTGPAAPDYNAVFQATTDTTPAIPVPEKPKPSWLKRVWNGAVDLVENPGESAKTLVRAGASGLGETAKTVALAAQTVFTPGARATGTDAGLQQFDSLVDTGVHAVRDLFKYHGSLVGDNAMVPEDPTATPANQRVLEDIGQFVTGMIALGGPARAGVESLLAKTGLTATGSGLAARLTAGAAREVGTGGLISGAALDPYRDRLSNVVATGPEWVGRPVAQFLAATPTDDELTARVKAGIEGGLLSLPFWAGTEALSRTFRAFMPARKAVATALLARAARDGAASPEAAAVDLVAAEQVASQLHPDDAVDVVLTTNNQHAVVERSWFKDETVPQLVHDGSIPKDSPRFDSEADANAFAASVNLARQNSMIEPTDVQAAFERVPVTPQTAAQIRAKIQTEGPTGVGNAPVNPEKVRQAMFDTFAGMTSGGRKSFLSSMSEAERNQFLSDFSDQLPAKAENMTDAQIEQYVPAARLRGRIFTGVSHGDALYQASQHLGVSEATLADEANAHAYGFLSGDTFLSRETVAQRLNLNYVQTTDEAKATINSIMENWLPPTPISNEETAAAAREIADGLGTTPENVLAYARSLSSSTEDLPQRVTAVRMWLATQIESTTKLARAAEMYPDNVVAQTELRKAMQTLQNLAGDVSNASTNVGRTLQAHQITVGADDLRSLTNKPVAEMSDAELRGTARLLASSQSPEEVGQALSSTLSDKVKAGYKELRTFAVQLYMNALLSKPTTHLVNFVANSVAAAQVPIEYMFAKPLTAFTNLWAKEGVATAGPAGTDLLVGLWKSLGDSFRAARRAFDTGESILDPGTTRAAEAGTVQSGKIWDAIGNQIDKLPFGRYYRLLVPSRWLTGADELATQANYRSFVRAQAMLDASQEGITDPAILTRRAEDAVSAAFDANGRGIMDNAKAYANYATFKGKLSADNGLLEDLASRIQGLTNNHPELKTIVPFIRTPTKIFEFQLERVPGFALLLKNTRTALAQGGQPAALALTRQTEGAALLTGAWLLWKSGSLVGRGPGSLQTAKQWRDIDGRQPYSVRVGDQWIKFDRLDPQLGIVAAAADFWAMHGAMSEQDQEGGMSRLFAAATGMATSRTYLRGPVTFLDALMSGQPGRWRTVGSQIVGGFVPNALGAFDSTVRATHSFIDEVAARTPGWSSTLEPQRNLFGETILKPSVGQQLFNPFTTMKVSDNPQVALEMIRLGNLYGRGFSMPNTTQAGVDWTDRSLGTGPRKGQSPYDRWISLMDTGPNGTTTRQDVERILSDPRYRTSSLDLQYNRIAEAVQRHQEWARQRVLNEYPQLRSAMQQADQQRRATMLQTQSPTVQQSQSILTP